MQQHLDAIRSILLQIGERVEGNLVCDIHPDNLQTRVNSAKIFNLQYLARGKKKICEIGVNAGHSLLLMLEVNPTASYVLFDIGMHQYTRPCIDYIRGAYPNTSIEIIYGDSKETLPLYMDHFDLIHVDGGHEYPEVASDYTQARRLIEPACPIIFDDFDFPLIRSFLEDKLKRHEIIPFEHRMLRTTSQHLVFTNPA